MPLLVLISGPGLELRLPHVGPCNSAEPRAAWVTEAGALRTRVRKEGLRLGSEASCSGTGLPAVELPGLLGQILLPSVSPRVFVFVCFCSSDSGSAMRLAELSVRAFEVGAQGWGACCVQAWGLRLPPTLRGRARRACARSGPAEQHQQAPKPSAHRWLAAASLVAPRGALAGGAAANLGAPWAPCTLVGQIPEAGCRGRPVSAQRARAVAVAAQYGTATALNLTFRGRPGANSHLWGLQGLFTGSSPTKHNSLI